VRVALYAADRVKAAQEVKGMEEGALV
jgi:hypothetical protein